MKKHLSVFGIGPIYVILIMILTFISIRMEYFQILPNLQFPFWNIFGKFLAVLFVLIGFLLWFNSVAVIKLDKKIRENQLVTTGAYAWVRNPIYTGISFLLCGSLFWRGNIYLLFLPVLYYVLMTFLVKFTEEKWLTELYGQTYIDYCKRVNRCIPWFPKKHR